MSRREIATCRTYQELQQALRQWAAEIGMSRMEIDNRSGLQNGYSGKVLATHPSRNLGTVTLPLMLGALGCYLVLAADESDIEKIRRTIVPRDLKMVRSRPVAKADKIIVIGDYLRDIARRGGKATAKKVSSADLRRFGRMGAAKRHGYRFRG